MTPLGTIVEILSRTLVLIRADVTLDVDGVLVVFVELKNQQLAEKYKLNVLQIPKGEVTVVAHQENSFYIAETFRPAVESGQIIEKQPSILSGLFPAEIIKKKVPGEPSAELATVTTELKISKMVEVGDKVGLR